MALAEAGTAWRLSMWDSPWVLADNQATCFELATSRRGQFKNDYEGCLSWYAIAASHGGLVFEWDQDGALHYVDFYEEKWGEVAFRGWSSPVAALFDDGRRVQARLVYKGAPTLTDLGVELLRVELLDRETLVLRSPERGRLVYSKHPRPFLNR